MDSEMAALEGRLQVQEKEDQFKGESYGENLCFSAGKKKRLTVYQVELLEKSFNIGNKLEHETKVRLAKEIGLQPRQVAIWFQNRRARCKTKKMEFDFDSLNTEYDKLKKDYDNLVLDNQKLKSEVDELRSKWVATEMMKNPFEQVEAMDSSEFGKLSNIEMGSFRQDEGSRSSSKSDGFYSESSLMENQLQSEFLQDEEDDSFKNLGKLENGSSVNELIIDSYNVVPAVFEDQSFYFWPC